MTIWNRNQHTKLIADFRMNSDAIQSKETHDVSVIRDIADAMNVPPPEFDDEYMKRLERAAAYLGFPSIADDSASVSAVRDLKFPNAEMTSLGSRLTRGIFNMRQGSDSSSSESLRNRAMRVRNVVFDFVNSVSSFSTRAKNAGFSPPDNPFVKIAELNTGRVGHRDLVVDISTAHDIVLDLGAYVDLLKASVEGKINFERDLDNSAQLSSLNMSFEGFGGSSDASVDLLKFLPDMDMVKRRRAEEALAVLDFKRRRPKLLFTANYAPDGQSAKGSIVGWRRMPDASGYVLTRRNIFDGTEKSFTFTNSNLDKIHADVREYVKTWAMGFYDNVDVDKVYAAVDKEVTSNAFYVYKLQAFQTHNESKGSLFTIETMKSNLTPSARNQIKAELSELDPGQGSDTISPYPVLAQRLLGDSRHDWILAAVNIRESISRSDSRTTTRKYSYIAAQLNFIFEQMDAGKFVVPKNISDVIKNVNDGVSTFGIMQVIQEVLNDTGTLFHFEGKDSDDDPYFDRIGSKSPETSDVIATVAAAIDPETAILNLRSFATNMSLLLAGGFARADFSDKKQSPSRSGEIDIPETNVENVNDDRADDQVQFLQKLDNLDESRADLTTFDGISKLIRTIRIMSDFGSHRGAPVTTEAQVVHPADVTIRSKSVPAPVVTKSKGPSVT